MGEAILLGPGGGETVTDRAERTVRILAAHELADVTWSRYESGERGPDPHVHQEHADAFYVLEGELLFELGREAKPIRAPAGTLVLVPENVIHAFRNESGAQATFLNIHAPSGGFAASLRGDAEGFDSFDPPPDGGRDPGDVVVRGPGVGETLSMGIVYKAQVGDGEGTLSLTEFTLPPSFPGPLTHRHARMVDSFFVLAGILSVRTGDEVRQVSAGSFALVPPGIVHTFSNPSDDGVRILNLMAPGGLEQYLKEVSAASSGGVPDPETMAAIASRYDFHPI